MENDNNSLCKANIRCEMSNLAWVFTSLWWIIVGYAFYFTGPYYGESQKGAYKGSKYLWGIPYHEHYEYRSTYYNYVSENERDYPLWLFFGTVITIIVFLMPLFIRLIRKAIAKRCKLELTEGQIEGQLKTLFGKKKLQMPIDHLDNVMTSNGFFDKIRSGETLLISSNSGLIKFHYVQNAEEFAQAAMKRINEVKKSALQSAPAPVPVQNISGGDAMEKINSLKQMLENGLITQEDFDSKKADILSKM